MTVFPGFTQGHSSDVTHRVSVRTGRSRADGQTQPGDDARSSKTLYPVSGGGWARLHRRGDPRYFKKCLQNQVYCRPHAYRQSSFPRSLPSLLARLLAPSLQERSSPRHCLHAHFFVKYKGALCSKDRQREGKCF